MNEQHAAPRLRGHVEILPLDLVMPNAWNPNEVPEHVMDAIRYGFRVDGWLVSHALLVWATDEIETPRNVIIDGEHRWRAALDVGLREGPMVRLYGLTEHEAKALTIKLDQKRGEWREDGLARVLAELAASGEVLAVDYGFTPGEIDALLALGSEGASVAFEEPSADLAHDFGPDAEQPRTAHAPEQHEEPTSARRVVIRCVDAQQAAEVASTCTANGWAFSIE